MINKHKSNKIKENSNTVRHLNNGTDHRHSKSCCDQSSPARRTMTKLVLWQLSVSVDECTKQTKQATGLDAWASRVKCPARFVSHIHEICIYIWVVYSLCLFITVTWWYVWCIEWASGNQEEVQACLVTLWLFIISFSKSDILAWPVSNLSAAPVMHGCIPARGGFEWVIRCEFSAD